MASSAEKATRDPQVVLWILAHQGFLINMKKCLITPTRMIFNSPLSSQGEGLQDKEGLQVDAEPDRGSGRSLAHLIGACIPALSGPSVTPDKGTTWQSSELRPQSPDVRGHMTWWATRLNAQIHNAQFSHTQHR